MSSSWPKGRFRRSWPRLGGSSSSLSQHLEPNLHCPAGSKRSSGPGGMVTESARRLDRWTDATESRGRRRQGVVMLISGVKGYQNPTKHPPLLVLLDELSSVANKRPYASNTSTHLTSLHLCEIVLLRAPNVVTCPHMYTPLDRSPPSHHGCVKFFFFFFLLVFYTRNTRNKDPPSYHLLGVVLQT